MSTVWITQTDNEGIVLAVHQSKADAVSAWSTARPSDYNAHTAYKEHPSGAYGSFQIPGDHPGEYVWLREFTVEPAASSKDADA